MNTKNRARERFLWKAFRLTLSDWDVIFNHQNKVCAICKKPQGKTRFHTDHDHRTGVVRGLLCSQCNRALGKVEDPRWQWGHKELYHASVYLATNPATDALGRVVRGFSGKISGRKGFTKRFKVWAKQ